MILATTDADRLWTWLHPRLKHARPARLGPEENSSKALIIELVRTLQFSWVSPPSCLMIPSARSSVPRPVRARVLTRENAMQVKRHGSPFLIALVRLAATSRSSPSETKSCRGAQKSGATARRRVVVRVRVQCRVRNMLADTKQVRVGFRREDTRSALLACSWPRSGPCAEASGDWPDICSAACQRRAAHLLCRDVRCRTWISTDQRP